MRREGRGKPCWILRRLMLILRRWWKVQVSPPGLTPVPPSWGVDVQMYHRPAVRISLFYYIIILITWRKGLFLLDPTGELGGKVQSRSDQQIVPLWSPVRNKTRKAIHWACSKNFTGNCWVLSFWLVLPDCLCYSCHPPVSQVEADGEAYQEDYYWKK